MENCLVTKLKGTVDNDNLEKLGVLRMQILKNNDYTENPCFIKITTVPVTGKESDFSMKLTNGEFYRNTAGRPAYNPSKTEVKASNLVSNAVYLPNVDGYLEISKYAIASIYLETSTQGDYMRANLSETYYSTLHSIIGMYWVGKITDCNPENITYVDLEGNVLIDSFDILDLTDFNKLTYFKVSSYKFNGGDIITLKNMTALSTFTGYHLTGSIEKLVAEQVKKGRTLADNSDDSHPILNFSTNLGIGTTPHFNSVTYNGSTYRTTGTGSGELKWRPTTSSVTGAVTDILLGGVAIAIDADGNKVADVTW